jgi:death-on-curing protein
LVPINVAITTGHRKQYSCLVIQIPRYHARYASRIERLSLIDFLVIAEIHTGIDARQLARMPRVVALAESALAAPFANFAGIDFYPDFHAKAGIYASRIVHNHPLPDGNKRTAYDVMREFIDRNGVPFAHGPGGLDATAKVVEDLAADILSERDFIAWVAERIA